MPGNEVGDRVHNFFGQENLSQGQHHSQAIDGNWPGLSNNLWVGGQRQIGGPFISSLKNYNVQQLDPERAHGSQSSHMAHGLNFTQSNLKPDFGRVQSPNQQPALNGYVHGNQVFQTRQSEANFLGVDTETNRHNLVARGISISQHGNGPEHNKKHSMRMEASESPVSFDFFGGQQQMSSQHLNVLQSMPRQQAGNSDMQLLQRHVLLAQFQEFHRQQQLQQLEPRQHNVTNQVPSYVKQTAGNHSPSLINGVPINEASNNLWQPELVAGNTNWLQHGASPVIQRSSSGQVFSPEQGQGLRLMDAVPQQADESLYGVSISSTSGTPGSYSHIQMDKAAMQQISANNNSSSGNMYATYPDQVSMQEGARQDFQGKNAFGSATGQGLSSGFDLENLQQPSPQQRSPPMQAFQGRQEVTDSSEQSHDKSFIQVSSSQNVATLDPAEEKILFGSDDNIWEAFGRNTSMGLGGYNMLDGSEYSGGYPVAQSGSWSALMQSAVAETSSVDTGIQEEWCGPSFQNSEPPIRSQQPSTVNHGGKPQEVWGDNNFQLAVAPSSRPSSLSVDANRPTSSINSLSLPQFQEPGFRTSQGQGDMLQTDASQRFVPKYSEQGNKWSDRGSLQKHPVEGSQVYATVGHPSGVETNANSDLGSWTRQQSTSSLATDTHPYNKANGWNFIDSVSADGGDKFRSPENTNSLPAQSGDRKRGMHDKMVHAAGIWRTESIPNSNAELEHAKPHMGIPQVGREASCFNNIVVPNSSTLSQNQESKQQLPSSQKLDFWKVDSSVNSKGGELVGKNQHNLGKSPQILESSRNNGLDRGKMVEMHEVDKNNKDNCTDGFFSNVLHHTSTGGLKENVWSDVGDSRTISGGKQKTSDNGGRRPPGTHKFQYHPMGDVDVDNEPSNGAKHGTHSQILPQQASRGIKGYDQGSFGQSRFVGQTDKKSLEMEKGHLPGGQGETKGSDATPSRSMFPSFAPVAPAPFDRGMGNYGPSKVPPSSQRMLELLHKVDHPREPGSATRLSSSERNMSSERPEAETSEGSVGHVQRNQPSSSQNFGLQLAPPSQRLSSSDHAVSSQSFSQTGFDSVHVMHEVGEKGAMQVASRDSAVPLPTSYEPSQGHGNNISTTSGQVGNKASFSNIQGSTAFPSGFLYGRNLENQHMQAPIGRIMANQSVNFPFSRLSSGTKQLDDSSERAQASHSVPSLMPDMPESIPHNNLASSAEALQLSSTDQTPKRNPAQQILEPDVGPSTEPSVQQGTFSKALPNAWTNVPRQHTSLTAQPSKMASSSLKSQLQSNSSLVTTFPDSPKVNEQDTMEGRNGLSGIGVISANSQSFADKEQDTESSGQQVLPDQVDPAQKTLTVSQGKEAVVNHFSEASLANHAASQRDIEAFGRSLRPNNSLHPNYSLLHQVQAMKSMDTNSTDRSSKRLKGSDFGMDPQQVGPEGGQQSAFGSKNTVRDTPTNHASVLPGDSKMLSFSSKLGDNWDSNACSWDMFAFNQNNSNNLPSGGNAPSIRGEHPLISPQMAPSWFDQYGTFKNGQMLPVYDMQRSTATTSAEQPFVGGKLADDLHTRGSLEQINASADGSRLGNILQVSTPTSAASEHFTSPHLMPHATDQRLLVVRPKKRKSATSELLPWHMELMTVSQRLQTISVAEAEWTKATNRLAEKVEDEVEMVEDALPGLRIKRRLILTTQLMQQLLHPPPAAVLSLDASSQYENVAYFCARLTLGDACSAVCCSETEAPSPADDKNPLSEKLTTPERIDKYYSQVVEDFIGRARKLESDLLRLDKRASILDLRVECQDLEKFSVINRFARFHGRGQADGAETSSSDGTLNAQKSCPQKYVTGLPMPRNLPDRVQCLSL